MSRPARAESDAMSKDLLKRGFKFVGSTICYAFMQATGMVNDHTVDCFRYHELKINRSLDRVLRSMAECPGRTGLRETHVPRPGGRLPRRGRDSSP